MKIELHELETMSIEEFADRHGLVMEVHERSPKHCTVGGWKPEVRYYAHFKDVEIREPGVLVGAFGDGATPELAIANYAKRISGQVIVINAFGKNRQDVCVPLLCKEE